MGGDSLWWRSFPAEPTVDSARRLIVVTDIDGSLLEPGAEALPCERAALDFLAARPERDAGERQAGEEPHEALIR